jgi:putative ABC transport system permease protein
MLLNYFKIAFRNLYRQKGYSFINIIGLSVGMAASILILLWVQDELSFDRFHKNTNNLYRVLTEWRLNGEKLYFEITPAPLADLVKAEVPEVSNATRFHEMGRMLLNHNDITIYEQDGAFADPAFLEMFTFPLIAGDNRTALNNPYSIVVSEELAHKYFGDEQAIGKTMRFENTFDMIVTGVFQKVPSNSHIKFQFLVPFIAQKALGRNLDNNWNDFNYSTYIQAADNADADEIRRKLKLAKEKQLGEDGQDTDFLIQSVNDIHLESSFLDSGGGQGDKQYVYIFSVVAVFILLIACINFMNLATARSAKRAKEVGLRKVIGANRQQLIWQFLGESTLLTFVALVIALLLVHLLLPVYNDLSSKELVLSLDLKFVLGLIAIALITGLLAGSYPALLLSSFQPAKVLKGIFKAGTGGATFRKTLVVVQFTLSIILIVSTIIIYNQLSYIRTKKLGYNHENIVAVSVKGNARNSYLSLKNELLKQSEVISVTSASQDLNNIASTTSGGEWEGKPADMRLLLNQVSVDHDFINTFGIEMAQGRAFSQGFASDSTAFIINEEAAAQMGIENPVGARFSVHGVTGKIVGVAKNFHFKSMHAKIEPMLLFVSPNWRNRMYIKVNADNIPATIATLEKTWKQFEPNYPFEYQFLDESYDKMYRAEQRAGKLFNYFAGIAIITSCLGLFGLAAYTAEQKSKEISIRKVLGASVVSVTMLFSREFTRLVIVAMVLATPVAWYLMNKWLEDFAYRIEVEWWVFVVAGATAFLIALLTISYQSIKTALSNPVNSLRSE